MHTKMNQTMEKDNENILLKSRSSRACIRDGYHFYFSTFKGIVGNGVRVTATHRGMADTPQASTPGENSSHPLQIVATTYGHDTNYMYRMLFHHLNPHHAHLTADGYHDGSQLAESDRSTLW